MKQGKKLCGYYDYTVILTYLGMLIGFTGIISVLQKSYGKAMVCLMIAGLCDMFDGTIAATKERNKDEKCFGIQIDSMSDLICFGVLPALMVYNISPKIVLTQVIISVYVLCTLIRLSYFNILEEKRQEEETGSRTSYMGLPVTTVALILPAVYILYNKLGVQNNIVYSLVLASMAGAYVSTFKINKPKTIGKVVIGCIGLLEFVVLVMGGIAG